MIFLNSASSAAALVFYLPGVCTHTDTDGKQRKARVQNILKSSKKTQYLMNTLYLHWENSPKSTSSPLFGQNLSAFILWHWNQYQNKIETFSNKLFRKKCVFSRNFHYFATSPSQALGCYWLYRNGPANRSDCTLALGWELGLKSLQRYVGEGWVAVDNEKKNTVLLEHYAWLKNNDLLNYIICTSFLSKHFNKPILLMAILKVSAGKFKVR